MGTNKTYEEGKEDGILTGVRYWESNRIISKTINSAAAKNEITEKMKELSGLQNQLPHLYKIINNNPNSEELKIQQKGLEDLAQGHGFVITEKGIFLDNEKYGSQ